MLKQSEIRHVMPGPFQVVIVYNKANHQGLSRDAQILADTLPAVGRACDIRLSPVKIMDSREPPVVCDLCIHLEVPQAVWFPWARTNAILVNHEWWESEWKCQKDAFDVALFRDSTAAEALRSEVEARETIVIPWFAGSPTLPKPIDVSSRSFGWFLGGSVHKREAAAIVLPLWKESQPRLTVYTTEPLPNSVTYGSNVTVKVGFLRVEDWEQAARSHGGHLCLSTKESYGQTAGEAELFGAYRILNRLPCYMETYSDCSGVSFVGDASLRAGDATLGANNTLSEELDAAVSAFLATDLKTLSKKSREEVVPQRREKFSIALQGFLKEFVEALQVREEMPRHMPPLLNAADCPPISVVTLVHNRPRFVENACLNLLSADQPRDKIEWIVIDDSDAEQSASNRIVQFQEKFAPGIVTQVPLVRKRSIGQKRNLGVERAKHDIILMMDDDDHYPSTSFRRRVAYLLKARKRQDCAACTTIAMQDLLKGTSAVNVPPQQLGLGKRCSEATLTFTRDFWKARKFPDVGIAEGEGFIEGRESQVAEIPPQQIIVALSHNQNVGGRKVPDGNPGCFWGFPRPLLEFLHGLVGIKVEAA